MEPREVIRDIEAGGAVVQPWSVLVQHGRVVAVHDPGGDLPLQRAAHRVAERSGEAVVIYQVDARLLPPPAPGTAIDPVALGWVEVYRWPERM
jgi:hypothetical protein